MRSQRILGAILVAAWPTASAVLGMPPGGTAGAAAVSHTIRPGVGISVADNTCEAGFVFAQGHRRYLGVPASCFGTAVGEGANGCLEAQDPYGTPVDIKGARHKGHFMYSSFSEMQLRGGKGHNRCFGNDIALVAIDPRDYDQVSAKLPGVKAPTGVARKAPAEGAVLTAYVNGAVEKGTATTSSNGGWYHGVNLPGTVSSTSVGAPVVNSTGRAVGMESVIPSFMGQGESKVSDLKKELAFLRTTYGFHHVHLLTV